MVSLPDFKREIRAALLAVGIEPAEAAAEADLIVDKVTGLSATEQIIFDKEVPGAWRQEAEAVLARRRQRVPLQYILARTKFMGLEFVVAPAVFIPRHDTETLVETALRLIPLDKPQRVIDIGTGSGIVAVTLAWHLPLATLTAVDLSPPALQVAGENAIKHGVSERIRLVQADWRLYLPRPLDVIVSNPPYIPLRDKDSLAAEVVEHEPHSALFGEDEDGLGHYRQLAKTAPECFEFEKGLVIVECGDGQSEHVAEIFRDRRFSNVQITNDMSGKARVISAAWTKE